MEQVSTIQFSVIIPAYNAEQTIVDTLRSVLAQTHPPLEVIVVNDGSTDNTEALLLAHFKDQIVYLPLSRNSGPGHARNAGLAIARGSHIAFQDADDIWHREKLALLHTVLLQHREVKFLYHPYTLSPVDFEVSAYPLQVKQYSFLKLLLSNPIGTPCVVLQHHPGLRFDERMHHMEDYDLFLRAAYRDGVYLLPIPLTQVNRPILSAGGQSSNRWKMRLGEITAYRHLVRLNAGFILLIPFLVVAGLVKHFVKAFRPPRTNY